MEPTETSICEYDVDIVKSGFVRFPPRVPCTSVHTCQAFFFFFLRTWKTSAARARVPCFCSVIHYAALHSLNPKRAQETFVLSSMPRNDWCAPSANLQRSLAGSLLRIEVSSCNPSPPRACLRTILTPPILILLPPLAPLPLRYFCGPFGMRAELNWPSLFTCLLE
ncbi:hypothetical protein LY78DRAFT_299764 [Colletotrichum sublineola]|nr:hypothetical protein LY78DRAFT_299764 [Colletotrichum sublineola]